VDRISLPKLDLVCWKEGWSWLIGIEIPEELHIRQITQNGESLECHDSERPRYPLAMAKGPVELTTPEGEKKHILPLKGDRDYFVFKMRKNWREPGRSVQCCNTGH
jgi:hypothetical protein